jgi:uncharacterized membrane protein
MRVARVLRCHRVPFFNAVRRHSAILVVVILVCPVLSFADHAERQQHNFVNSIGEFVFALAWPTATYERARFGDIESIEGGIEVSFRLHGKSAFGGGPLWVDVVLEIKGGQVTDLRWGRHNGILAAPGETIKVLGEALEELNREHPQNPPPPSSSPTAEGYAFKFTNGCRHPVQLAIRYLDTNSGWKTVGWWSFAAGETARLNGGNGTLLRSNNTFWYYFAETTNGAQLEWRGDQTTKVGTREVRMRKAIDDSGESEWAIDCD